MQRAVEFEANGARHQLRLDAKAMMQIEADTGLPFGKAVKLLNAGEDVRVTDMVTFFRAALNGGKLTMDEAAEVFVAVGFGRGGELLGEAITLAFPQEAKGASGTGKRKGTAA
ncbi:GTA-gp10 family protein [Paragemmobacter ruber]|uniref:Gene transfer agent family protein n=1 Tax=Paragemmobacter ruber TaxID=1985673 RepID=A0ABW9Y1U0_9RHOB|nr:GTA-gp10 family protein [Rhodobacter ruber]NBE05929.1 gene transfer agent family protein [Rhodobacter ruber]